MGIDEESWQDFEKNLESNLYVIWNRMSSGSYHPQAVREVEIPKRDGTSRKLGIPTLRDRIAQQVVKVYMERQIDHIFHNNSYGYRPKKSAHQAVEAVLSNCKDNDWVIDMDISKFFDEIDHELMLKAVSHVIAEKWVSMYVKRWLEMPVQDKEGNVKGKQGKGTPQGGVISPLLANLYLHFTLDKWLENNYPQVSFVRYADDVVIHCKTKAEAEEVLQSIKERLQQTNLSIKESKTKIAYCRDYKRKQKHEHVKFEFLGFSFQPITVRKDGDCFTIRGIEITPANQKKMVEAIRKEEAFKNTSTDIKYISSRINARLRGWINYYSIRGIGKLFKVARCLNYRLIKWIMKKYKIAKLAAVRKFNEIKRQNPRLFYHWELGIC